MKKEKCIKCGYEWIKRVDDVKRCPRCKTHYWKAPKVRIKK